MNVEGIVIHKVACKERDVIAKLLLRDGTTLSLYFYGGQGGGKKNKGSVIELGFCLYVDISENKKKRQHDLVIAKEWTLKWSPRFIRTNHRAYYLTTFWCEIIQKVALKKDLEYEDEFNQGLFSVLSNSLFYLDKTIEVKKEINTYNFLLVFLVKLSFHTGLTPNHSTCHYCNEGLAHFEQLLFEPANGGFTCPRCISTNHHASELEQGVKIYQYVNDCLHKNFTQWDFGVEVEKQVPYAFHQFMSIQNNWSPTNFKSYGLIF